MIKGARKSSEASETAKNKKPRGSWGGGHFALSSPAELRLD